MVEKTTYEKIYLEYKPKVTSYVSGKINNSLDAEDLVSKIFIKILEKYESFDETKASISTWIYTITNNTVIDFYRGTKTFAEMDESFSYVESGFDDIYKKESLEELAIALEKLDQRSRDLIILHYYSGLTLKDVASRMSMSYANVKIIHNKALNQLKFYMNA